MKQNASHNKISKFTLTPAVFWGLVVLLVLLRCGATGLFQQAYIWVGGAPLDDELMFRAAGSITAGEWLGSYDYLTLSKSMFFPVWLALLHALQIPYLLGGALLWCGAALLAAFALRPLWRQFSPSGARLATLGVFAVLAFLPSSTAAYTLRVYRDNIFPALCLLVFAGLAGAALRAVWPQFDGAEQPNHKNAPLWPWLLAAGAGLAAGYLNREDAGLFLLPFAILGTIIILVVLVGQKRWRSCAALALPYAMLAAGVLIFCTLNYSHYGVFALSDFSSGSFADAMGAMSRVATTSEEPLLSVPADARAELYAAVPELEPLRYWLEQDPQLQNDFRDPTLDDYRAGSFYWAIRRAAQFTGVYDSAAGADAYWADVAAKINAACDTGALPARSGRRSGTTQPFRASDVPAILTETANGLLHAATFKDCEPYETLRSIGTQEDFAAWSSYLHCAFNAAAEAGKDTPYYSPWQKMAFTVLDGLTWLYRLLFPIALAGAALLHFTSLRRVVCQPTAEKTVPWLLLFGFIGMALLRCAMIAFVEVTSFGIGTSTMYLATVHPLLALYTLAVWLMPKPLFHQKES